MPRSLTPLMVALACATLLPSRAMAQAEAVPDCVPAREYDRAVVDSVSRQLRRAMAPRHDEAQIRASIAAAVELLRAEGRLTCLDGDGGTVETPKFGALALGPGAAWGTSWDHPTQAAADARARRECGGGACAVVLRIAGPACGAYATRGTFYGWGTGPDRARAERRALAECAARAGRRCAVQVWGCNSRP